MFKIAKKDHVEQLLSRVCAAQVLGQAKKRDYWISVFLDSHDAKMQAVARANKQFKFNRRFSKTDLQGIAQKIDPWKGTSEPAIVHLKRKPSDPDNFRIFMDFGIENRSLQYLVRRPLEVLADIVPYQYTLKGGLRSAILHVAKAMSAGPVWAIELDVEDCYPSFNANELPSLLPLPKEVTNHVVVANGLHLVPGNIQYHFGPSGDDDPGLPWELDATLEAARRGIPQGSAVSSLVAETMLAIALRQIPDGIGERVAYGDNCLVIAAKEGDVVTMIKALGGALECHPAGRFRPNVKYFPPGEPIKFLGHCLTAKLGGKIRIDPSPQNREKFEAKIAAKLNHLLVGKLGKRSRKRRYREAKHFIQSWTAAFALCDGIGDLQVHWLNKLAKVEIN
ncbi:MAG TPA: hypothetical protein VMU69_06115 [Bradyrhizobium sp.]|nr:hypothetical protein [Bradyrhizobium sp.]